MNNQYKKPMDWDEHAWVRLMKDLMKQQPKQQEQKQ